jgi:hypothetical protein
MRARTVASGLGVFLAVGCGSVPDLRFGEEDASVVSVIDSSLPAPTSTTSGEAGPPPSLDDAGTHPAGDGSIADGSSPSDAGRVDAAPTACTNPPPGAQCCGAVLCRPGGGIGPAGYCNCMLCPSSCATEGVCCMSHQGTFESCATSIASCPAP